MTANEKAEEPEEPSGPHPYFMAIEEVFLELRGSPLQLSSKDWHVAREWHEEGIPLELVERTVREIFERRKAKAEVEEEKEDKVWGLGHCKRSVKAAWRRQQKLEAPGAAGEREELDLPARLESLAAALPAGLARRQAAVKRIVALEGDAEAIEASLTEIDRELLQAGSEGLPSSEHEEIERQLAASRSALADRLPAAELERAEARLREEILRQRLALPVLSLFAPEASGMDSDGNEGDGGSGG